MAEQDEAIKVVVEVVDKFSKPLNDLKKELDRISDRGGDGATKVKKNFDGLRDAATQVGNALNVTLVPALRALGISFVGVGATIATAVTALKGFAGTTEVLSRLSRETGVSIDKMREMEAVGRRLGISAGEMRQGWRDFAAEMHKTRLAIGESAKDLRLRGQGEFGEQLRRTKTNAEALDLILKKLDTLHDPQHRRDFLKARGLPPGLADANRKERERLIKEWRDSVGATSKEDEAAAERFEHSLWRMGNSFEKLTEKMAEQGTFDKLAASLNTIADLIPRLIKAVDTFQGYYGTLKNLLTPPQLPGGSWEEWWQSFKQRMGAGGGNAPATPPATAPASPQKMSYGAGTFGGAQVIRASLVGGGDEEKTKETIAEGVVEGLKKWALDQGAEGPGAHGGVGGDGAGGGAPVIRASLGGNGGDGGSSGGRRRTASRGDGSTGGDGGDGGDEDKPGSKASVGAGGAEPDQSKRPYRIGGKVTVGGKSFTWESGGARRGSLPYGDYPINFGQDYRNIGSVGHRIGSVASIGGIGGVINDPKYPGHPRAGIQIHPGSGATLDQLYTEGCFAVPRAQWPAFKKALLEESKKGPLMIHIGRNGRAEVMTRKEYEARQQQQTKPDGKPDATPRPPPTAGKPDERTPPPAPSPAERLREAAYTPENKNQFDYGAKQRWLGGMPKDALYNVSAARPPAVPRDRMMDASARQSQVAKIEGAASVRIDLAGYGKAPSGTTGPSSGIFSEVQLHRGSTIPYASESA
jgi:hypothetical protein